MSWYCKILHFIARHPIVLHGIVWYWIVLHWIDRYLIVLNDIAWCCVLLNGIALYWLINLVFHCMLLNAILLYSNYSENTNVTFQDALQLRFLGFRFKDFFLNKIFLGPRRSNIRNFCYNYPWPTWGPYFFRPKTPTGWKNILNT